MKRSLCLALFVAASAALPTDSFAQARSAAGAYLAARQAAMQSDYQAAALYYTQALARDRLNPSLMEDTIIAQLALGRVDRALPVAKILEEEGHRSQAAHMAIIADLLANEDYEALLQREADRSGIGPLVDGLLSAWAHIGLGNIDDGIVAFDTAGTEEALRNFTQYHKAMALAYVGDFEAAEGVFTAEGASRNLQTRRGAMARAEILSQLGRNADALAYLEEAFGGASDPEILQLKAALKGDEKVPFSHVTSVQEGAAEVFFSLAGALRNEAGPNYTLLYGRLALHLRPDHVDALLLNAELLENLGQYELAIADYKRVPDTDPAFHAAEIGRAEVLRRDDKPNAAIEVLEQLAKRFPDHVSVHSTLGDIFRQQENYQKAVTSYDTALDLLDDGNQGEWFLHYARAISYERLGEWPSAEADFRRALDLNPDAPQVLNYLGYSLVEKQIKLEEALDMIEKAVAASPDSGYIVDSLGWVLYRLGRYDEAVTQMELAVELMPVDPVVNDHLGDVYWAVGRYREAEFQWRRALSFINDGETAQDADPERIRRKLEIGLDRVLADEGAEPLHVVEDSQ